MRMFTVMCGTGQMYVMMCDSVVLVIYCYVLYRTAVHGCMMCGTGQIHICVVRTDV